MHGILRGYRSQHRGKFFAQLERWFEIARGIEIVFEEAVHRARDMAANRIQYFVFTAKSIRAARVDQPPIILSKSCLDKSGADTIDARAIGEIARSVIARSRCMLRQRHALALPGGDSAVEHAYWLMTNPAQHPPQTRGVGAALRVVSDNLALLTHALPAKPLHEDIAVRQRMAAILASART